MFVIVVVLVSVLVKRRRDRALARARSSPKNTKPALANLLYRCPGKLLLTFDFGFDRAHHREHDGIPPRARHHLHADREPTALGIYLRRLY